MAERAELTVGEMIRRLGPLDELREDLASFRRSARTFSSDRPRLIDEYRQQWVAVLDGEVVAHADSFPAVIDAVDQRQLPRSRVLVRFVDENVRTMILWRVEGRFGDTSGRPYVEGRVYFPRFDLEGDISFLVDTGADASLLNLGDVARIGVDIDLLEGRAESFGLGGAIECFVEPTWVIFVATDGTTHIYEVEMEIAPVQPDTLDLPSLLGREILDRWRMVYDPEVGVLEFDVRSADLSIEAD